MFTDPNAELADNVASLPSAGIVRLYPSFRSSMGLVVSSEILARPFVSSTSGPSETLSFCKTFAPAREGTSAAPRPTTSRSSLSFFNCTWVRATACLRSSGGLSTSERSIANEFESRSGVEPVLSLRGIGQRANTLVAERRRATSPFGHIVDGGIEGWRDSCRVNKRSPQLKRSVRNSPCIFVQFRSQGRRKVGSTKVALSRNSIRNNEGSPLRSDMYRISTRNHLV